MLKLVNGHGQAEANKGTWKMNDQPASEQSDSDETPAMTSELKAEDEADSSNESTSVASSASEVPLTRRQRRAAWTLSAASFLLSYILTAGPAVFLMDRFKLSMVSRILELLYAPLVLVVKANVPVIGPLIKAYIELFR
ncbi:MAG: hypothetical protein Fues2KO_13450 [Fuerstiella sp.]